METNIFRYIRLWWKLAKFSATLEMEYRLSFLLEIIVECAFFAVSMVGLRVVYWNVTEIAGWTYPELLMLYGVNMVFSELILGFAFIYNLRDLPNKIATGTLDIILTKPMNSQYAVSLWRPYFAMFPSLISGVIIAIIGFRQTGIEFHIANIFPFCIVFGSGLVMAYSLGMMISTISMWWVNAQPLPMLAQQFIFLSKHPYSVYSGMWKILFLTVIPVAFMVSIPSSIFLGNLEWWWIPASLSLAALFLYASHIFWNFALRHYSGASA